MKLYRTGDGNFIEHEGGSYRVPGHSWDALIAHHDLQGYLVSVAAGPNRVADFAGAQTLAPIGSQEVWAAGVTYYRSRDARMAESKDAGGGDFYDRVYSAERPELFFKATASRVAAPGEAVRIRSDAKWSVPEPELTPGYRSARQDHRLHHRERHEFARHRGRKSPLSAAGQGL